MSPPRKREEAPVGAPLLKITDHRSAAAEASYRALPTADFELQIRVREMMRWLAEWGHDPECLAAVSALALKTRRWAYEARAA